MKGMGILVICLTFLGGCVTIREGEAIKAAAEETSSIKQPETYFCFVCGRRFTSFMEHCPYDGTELKLIENGSN